MGTGFCSLLAYHGLTHVPGKTKTAQRCQERRLKSNTSVARVCIEGKRNGCRDLLFTGLSRTESCGQLNTLPTRLQERRLKKQYINSEVLNKGKRKYV